MIETDSKKRKEESNRVEKRKRERELSDLRAILSIPEGRRFIWRILEDARVFASCYDRHNGDMSFYEGKRDLGLMVWRDVIISVPEKYVQMVNEHESDRKREEKERTEFEKKLSE